MADEIQQDLPIADFESHLEMLPLYGDFGSFAPHHLGIPQPDAPLEFPVVLPTADLLYYEADPFISRKNEFGWVNGYTVYKSRDGRLHPILKAVEGNSLLKQAGISENPVLAHDLSVFSYAATEGSFISGGYTDLLRGLRTGLAYYIVQDFYRQTYGSRMWEHQIDFEEMEAITNNISGLPEVTGSTFLLDTPGFLFNPGNKLFARNMARLNAFFNYLAHGDTEMSRFEMKYDPDVVACGAGILFTLMKSGLFHKVFPEADMDKKMAIALADSETSPNPQILYDMETFHFPTTHAMFSTYLDMVLDYPVAAHAPRAFAFINRSLAEELRISDYITRMRATRGSLDLNTVGLESLKKAIALGEFKTPVETVPKSVFTSGSEVLDKYQDSLFYLLTKYKKEYDLKMPESDVQLEWDYEALAAFDGLLRVREDLALTNQADPELDGFLLSVYHEIRNTFDLLRGTVYWPEIPYEGISSYDDVVYEALEKNISMILVLNYHDEGGSHPFIRTWSTTQDIVNAAQELGLDSDQPSKILAYWYGKHGLFKKPYAALHIQANASYSPTIFRGVSLPLQHLTEIRLTTVQDMFQFHLSREDYKTKRKSKHVRL